MMIILNYNTFSYNLLVHYFYKKYSLNIHCKFNFYNTPFFTVDQSPFFAQIKDNALPLQFAINIRIFLTK
jgi:hypothetical protein